MARHNFTHISLIQFSQRHTINSFIDVQVCQTCSKEFDRLSVGFKDTKGMEAKYLDYSSLNNVFSFGKV